jgi:hypothetical protein
MGHDRCYFTFEYFQLVLKSVFAKNSVFYVPDRSGHNSDVVKALFTDTAVPVRRKVAKNIFSYILNIFPTCYTTARSCGAYQF